MQDYADFYPYVTLPKETEQPQKQISHFRPNPKIIISAILPPKSVLRFGLLLINAPLNSLIKA